jgi:hypothetical protein
MPRRGYIVHRQVRHRSTPCLAVGLGAWPNSWSFKPQSLRRVLPIPVSRVQLVVLYMHVDTHPFHVHI